MKSLFISICLISVTSVAYACSDPRCAWETADTNHQLTLHWDMYGKLLGKTKGCINQPRQK